MSIKTFFIALAIVCFTYFVLSTAINTIKARKQKKLENENNKESEEKD